MTTNGPPEPLEMGQIRTQLAFAFRDHFQHRIVGGEVSMDDLTKIKDAVTEKLNELSKYGPLTKITVKETKVVGDEVQFTIEGVPVSKFVIADIVLDKDQYPIVQPDPIEILICVKNLIRNGAPWQTE